MAETSASKLSKRIQSDGSTHFKGTSEPAGAVEGDLFYNTSTNNLFAHNGSSFIKVNSKTPTLSSVTGSIIVSAASNLTFGIDTTATGTNTSNNAGGNVATSGNLKYGLLSRTIWKC